MAVDHATVFNLLAPLPGGVAVGHQQLARRGDLIVTAELANGTHFGTYSGIRVRIVRHDTGSELGSNTFDFESHRTIPPRTSGQMHPTLDNLDQLHKSEHLHPEPMRQAITQYLAVFADSPPAQVKAPSRVRINGRADTVQAALTNPPTATSATASPAKPRTR
ncbi:hypothetical protein ABZW30_08350 [Kitasatospora sp. NPDC004669]|uniref:hypothetical protein n=1 Tax=Kitasatospora sp. NPDC004669 TaxID=3154555 RepID=UPI0033AFD125